MAEAGPGTLYRLGDTDLTVAEGESDIRGRKVIDSNGEEVGEVEDLMIDEAGGKVRFLEVASGGFLGIGEAKSMIPVDAITRITDDTVYIGKSREHVAGAPRYDPDLEQAKHWYDVYAYYGYAPFWGPGYVYPGFPLTADPDREERQSP